MSERKIEKTLRKLQHEITRAAEERMVELLHGPLDEDLMFVRPDNRGNIELVTFNYDSPLFSTMLRHGENLRLTIPLDDLVQELDTTIANKRSGAWDIRKSVDRPSLDSDTRFALLAFRMRRCADAIDERLAATHAATIHPETGETIEPIPKPQPSDAQLDDMRRGGLSIDGDNAYKRDLIDTILGALIYGKRGTNEPPPGHWAAQFWDIGRAEGEHQAMLQAEIEALRKEAGE